MVTGLKQLSRLFCEILYAACHFLDVSLVGEWPFLFFKTKYESKKQPLNFRVNAEKQLGSGSSHLTMVI